MTPVRDNATTGGETCARESLRGVLLRAGHRHTAQRAAVHDVLLSMRTHPTAEEIFRAVRCRIPDISLATVYRALETFEHAGVCQKLASGDGPARYDIRTDDHHHLRCVDCGELFDLEGPALRPWVSRAAATRGFEVLDCRLELVGRCDRCAPGRREVA